MGSLLNDAVPTGSQEVEEVNSISSESLNSQIVENTSGSVTVPEENSVEVETFDTNELMKYPDSSSEEVSTVETGTMEDKAYQENSTTDDVVSVDVSDVSTSGTDGGRKPTITILATGVDGTNSVPSKDISPDVSGIGTDGSTQTEMGAATEYDVADILDSSIADIMNLSPEELQELIGNMTQDEYKEFIDGIKEYYEQQIKILEYLLSGDSDNLGYLDYLDWIKDFLEEHQLFSNTVFDAIDEYDHQANELLDVYNYSYSADWFANQFPDANITYQDFLNMSRDDQWQFLLDQNAPKAVQIETYKESYINKINEMVSEEFGHLGITSYDQLMATFYDIQSNVEQINEAIKTTNNLHDSAWFDYLPYLKDFNEYDFHQFTPEELQAVKDSVYDPYTVSYDFETFHKQYPDISPMDYILALMELFPNIPVTSFSPIVNPDDKYDSICSWAVTIAEMFHICPQYAKIYSYLYNIDPKEAENYLKSCAYEINAIVGQIQAQEFLSSLDLDDGDGDAILKAIANILGVEVEGLIDGLEGFGEGVYYSIEALAVALGICEENRALSVSEYKKMYILQALFPKEVQVKAGLITDNGDGTYSNNLDANPLGIIDFTRKYSGLWLHHVYNVSQGIGNMLPSIFLSAINPAAGAWALGISAGGNAYHSAMVDGQNYISALFYGLFTGLSESITEKIFGGLPFLSDVKVTSFATYLKAVGLEAFQESFQGAMDYLYKAMFMGEPFPDLADGEAWAELLADIGTQGFYGALTAGIMQSPALISSVLKLRKINQLMSQKGITLEQQQEAINAIRDSNPEYKNLTDAEIKLMFAQQVIAQALSLQEASQQLESSLQSQEPSTSDFNEIELTQSEPSHLSANEKIDAIKQYMEALQQDPSNATIPPGLSEEEVKFVQTLLSDTPWYAIVPMDSDTEVVQFLYQEVWNALLSYDYVEALDGFRELLENNLEELFNSILMNSTVKGKTMLVLQGQIEAMLNYLSQHYVSICQDEKFANLYMKLKELIGDVALNNALPSVFVEGYQQNLQSIYNQCYNYFAIHGHIPGNVIQLALQEAITIEEALNKITSLALEYYNSLLNNPNALPPVGLSENLIFEINSLVEGYFITSTNPIICTLQMIQNGYSDVFGENIHITDNGLLEISNLPPHSIYVLKTPNSNVIIHVDENGNGYVKFNEIVTYTGKQLSLTKCYDPNILSNIIDWFRVKGSSIVSLLGGNLQEHLGVDQGSLRKFYDLITSGLGELSANISNYIAQQLEIRQQLIQIVKSYFPNASISDSDIEAYLKVIDQVGVCTYAATLNSFIIQFGDNVELINQIFGYDVIIVHEDGTKTINDKILLADYYTYLNGSNMFTATTNEDGTSTYNYIYSDDPSKNHQDVMNFSNFDQFEDFINHKIQEAGLNIQIEIEHTQISSSYGNSLAISELYEAIHNGMTEEGLTYTLSYIIHSSEQQTMVMYEEGKPDYVDSETGGHIVTILDATETGLFVQSWGSIFFVPYESLNLVEYWIDSVNMNIRE